MACEPMAIAIESGSATIATVRPATATGCQPLLSVPVCLTRRAALVVPLEMTRRRIIEPGDAQDRPRIVGEQPLGLGIAQDVRTLLLGVGRRHRYHRTKREGGRNQGGR